MGWTLIGRLTGIALFLGAFVAANAAPITPSAEALARLTVTPNPQVAAEAGEHAREHLPALLAHLGGDDADVAVRVIVSTNRGDVSTWVRPVSASSDGFRGRLIDPAGTLSAGDTVPVATAAVQDWHMIDRSGRMYGAFATRILLSDLAPTDAAAIRRVLTDTPVPSL